MAPCLIHIPIQHECFSGEGEGHTVSQSLSTRPPVSPELAFQSHQKRLGMLAWGKLAAL